MRTVKDKDKTMKENFTTDELRVITAKVATCQHTVETWDKISWTNSPTSCLFIHRGP